VDLSKLISFVEAEIALADSRTALTGAQKREMVVRRIVPELDRLVTWPPTLAGRIAEFIDGPFFAFTAEIIIHLVREIGKAKAGKTLTPAVEAPAVEEPAKKPSKKKAQP
jgi:hypothetical protein